MQGNKVLVSGWFSFEGMGATAGDLLARDVACEWLREAGRQWDIAATPNFGPGIDWRCADPQDYSDVVFVCGPMGNGPPVDEMLARFGQNRLIGLDLTMLGPLEGWNPFALLWERDSSRTARADIAILAESAPVPVIGVVLIPSQPHYKERSMIPKANEAIEQLLGSIEAARVDIDTELETNRGKLRTPAEVETLISRMDVVVTTRLHGMVLALKHGVPTVVIDSVAGGDKVTRQARAIGWRLIFSVETLRLEDLKSALNYCLSPAGKQEATRCRDEARAQVERVRRDFVSALRIT